MRSMFYRSYKTIEENDENEVDSEQLICEPAKSAA